MDQTAIPFLFMRGGSSRGPYFLADDLPTDRDRLAQVLLAAVGSGHPLNIDGIGGGNPVTTKVAILSKSDDDWADVDYFFAQVSVETRLVDFKPTCGNILTGVGPAALELGLIGATGPQTKVRIRAVNTGARILATVQTPNNAVTYTGDAQIDGVPGCSAPIHLDFMQVAGSTTGQMLPTGHLRDTVDGIEVTCMDVAMPMVIALASDFGLRGDESREALDQNRAFFEHMEQVRLIAGQKMGLGDCTKSVTPKFGLLAPARRGGALAVRYFMPWDTHPTLAVTGSQCLAACALCAGTVADGLFERPTQSPARLDLEHPLGMMSLSTQFEHDHAGQFVHISAGLTRTARLLARGQVYVPCAVWDGRR